MDKEWRNVWIFFGVIFLIWIVLSPYIPGSNTRIYSNDYEFPYWSNKEISYSFDSEHPCNLIETERIKDAFRIIQEETNNTILLPEQESSGDIIVKCISDSEYSWGGASFYEDGEMTEGFVEMIELNKMGEDYIYCELYPTTEIHEILHALGFDHINSKDSIMSEGIDEIELDYDETGQAYVCKTLDKEIIECLKYVYSNGEIGGSCDLPYIDYSSDFIEMVEIPELKPRKEEVEINEDCEEGTYEAINDYYSCCQDQNMFAAEDGYCYYDYEIDWEEEK